MPDVSAPPAINSTGRFAVLLLGIVFALLAFSGSARAADDSELKRLQATLAVINQELQAAYQQYQMASDARRHGFVSQLNEYLFASPDVQMLEDVNQRRREAEHRDRELAEQLDRILAYIKELEGRKKPVLDRIYELLQERASQANQTPGLGQPAEPPPPTEAAESTPPAKPAPSPLPPTRQAPAKGY